MSTSKSSLLVAAFVAISCGSLDGTASAAEQASSQGVLEEITVTARKREENLQDVGTSISAISELDIQRRADIDLQTFANTAPNTVIEDIQQGPGSVAAIYIRGVGASDVEKNFDPGAGVVVDGLFIGVNSGALIKALDLQSIEILRGPQGTLFGRNSIGGVINIMRRKPSTDAISGSVRAGGGNYGELALDGYINLPLSDSFALKIGAAKRDNDGWFFNKTSNEDVGKVKFTSFSPSFIFKPTDNFEFTYRYDKTEQDQDANTVLNMAQKDQVFCLAYGECAKSVQVPQSGNRYTVLQNGKGAYQTYFDSEMHIGSARLMINENNRVEYVYGKYSTDEAVYQDWDGSARTLYHTDRPAVWNQTSHEVRWINSGNRLDVTGGLYWWESDYRIDLSSYIGFVDVLFGAPPGTVVKVDQTVAQNVTSKAAFFEADYKLTDALTLTLGGRYTKDDKDSGLIDVSMPQLAVLGSFAKPFEKSWSEFTPKLNLRYRMSEDSMVYGLYSKGFRAGGFSGRPGTYEAASIPYNPETIDNFELGWKTEWMGGRVRLNGSVFMMQYDDKQEEQSVPTRTGTGQQTLVLNAAKAEINGLEIDFAALITENFTLSGNLGLMDAKFKKLVDTDPATPVNKRDLSYLKLRRTPDLTATISPNYSWNVANGSMWAQVDLRFVDDQELTFYNSKATHVKAHETVDASIGYQINDTTVSLWGSNLTNDDSWAMGYDVGTSITFPGLWTYGSTRPPRTYGLRITHNFGN